MQTGRQNVKVFSLVLALSQHVFLSLLFTSHFCGYSFYIPPFAPVFLYFRSINISFLALLFLFYVCDSDINLYIHPLAFVFYFIT